MLYCCTCRVAGYGQGVHKAAVPLGKTKLSNARVEQAGIPSVFVLKKEVVRTGDLVMPWQMIKKIKPKWPGKEISREFKRVSQL